MKVFAKLTILKVSEPTVKKVKNNDVPMAYVVATDGDTFLALTAWGEEKVQLCKEAVVSGVAKEVVLSITGKQVDRDDGSIGYFNNVTIKHFL